LAKRLGVDLRYVQGTQKGGRILKENVMNYNEGLTQEHVKKETRMNIPETPVGLRASKESPTELVSHTKVESPTAPHDKGFPGMATHKMTSIEMGMVKSMTYNTTVPQFFLMEEVYVSKLVEFRKTINKGREEKLSMMPFLIKTFSLAIKQFPRINSLYYPERPYEWEQHSMHNISIAIDSKNG